MISKSLTRDVNSNTAVPRRTPPCAWRSPGAGPWGAQGSLGRQGSLPVTAHTVLGEITTIFLWLGALSAEGCDSGWHKMLLELGRQSHPFCSGRQQAAWHPGVEGQGGNQTKGRVRAFRGEGTAKTTAQRFERAWRGAAEGGGGSAAQTLL